MKVAFDSSVLVAGLHRAHGHPRRAAVWIDAVVRGEVTGIATWHAITEVWSVLTRLPGATRPSPRQALEIVRRLRGPFDLCTVEPTVYDEALQRCADRGFSSGVVFDALHLVAAERAGADRLVTFNGADFLRLLVRTRRKSRSDPIRPQSRPALSRIFSGPT